MYKTSAGLGILQQFTTDKRLLLANIDRITLRTNNPTDPLAALQPNAMEDSGDPALSALALRMRFSEEQANRSRQDISTAGSLSTARFIAQGLAELPGRKSIIYFSESLQLYDNEDGPRQRTADALRDLADLANRAAVVFYTIDPRGLVSTAFTAADSPSSNPARANEQSQQRQENVNLSKDGLSLLAEETGGIFYHNRNDIGVALKEAVLDQDGYYLLAFTPDDDTFQKTKAGPRYHQLKVKVTRPGAQVRYRHGFVGTSDAERLPVQTNPVLAALLSPFRAVDVPVKLTPMFLHVNGTGSFLRNFAHVDVRPFTYKDVPADPADPDQTPWKEASLVVAAFLFDANGAIVERASQSQTLRARGDTFSRLQARGIEQQIILLAKKPGPYQVRVAVLDSTNKKTGSASQFVEIPDMAKKRLVLSDLTLNGEDHNKDRTAFSSPALRQMRPGERFFIGAFVYNAGPDLLMQISLYREGKLVYRSKKEPILVKADPASGARPIDYSLPLSLKAAPGEYAVELAVQDPAAPKRNQFAVRALDFTVR
ncbi:MAG: VWA domain-containing protein [Acidobacteria bacterium]|nr:VWA domain-containing protein [Acidobacteriota bacterium]